MLLTLLRIQLSAHTSSKWIPPKTLALISRLLSITWLAVMSMDFCEIPHLLKKLGATKWSLYGLTVVSAIRSTASAPSFLRRAVILNLGASLFLFFLSTKIVNLLLLVVKAP